MKFDEARLQYMRDWRKRNKARQKAWFRQHYINNRAAKLAATKTYAESHPEIIKKAKRNYVNRNRELLRAKGRLRARAYRKTERGIASRIACKHARRAAEYKAGTQLAYIKQWIREVRSKPFARCYWCGTKVTGSDIHFDHITPLSRGGTHTIGNLCASCADCNHRKHARLLTDWTVNGQMFLL